MMPKLGRHSLAATRKLSPENNTVEQSTTLALSVTKPSLHVPSFIIFLHPLHLLLPLCQFT